MTLDNMTGITKGSYTGSDLFCKSQLITCNRVKECNGVCPFEDALKHADKKMNEQIVIDHDREWIIGCIKHDGFIKTDRFDKANQIILDALKPIDCSDLPDIPRAYYEKIVGNMSHEINMLKQQLEDRPMVHSERPAEWIRHEDRIMIYYSCSKCGEIEIGTPPYCRKCGSYMKGGAE